MSISQSIDAPITTRDTVSMSGSLSSNNGNATGNAKLYILYETHMLFKWNFVLKFRWISNIWKTISE